MWGEALKGHVDGLLLACLESGPRHGYAVIEALREATGGQLDMPTGTVYPALHRLEAARLINGRWSVIDGRRRRTYQLTAKGRRALSSQRADWHAFSSMISTALGGQRWPNPA